VSLCVCGLRHTACQAQGPCYVVISGQVYPTIEHTVYMDA